MKTIARRVFSALMVCILVCSLGIAGIMQAEAVTAQEAVAWCESMVNEREEYSDADNLYQCFDFIARYAHSVFGYANFGSGVLHAKDLFSYNPGGGWTLIQGNADIQAGDIFVQVYNPSGHTGVVARVDGNTVYIIDQNNYGATCNKEYGLNNKVDYASNSAYISTGLGPCAVNVHKTTRANINAVLRPPLTPPIPDGYTAIYTAEQLNNIRNDLSGKYFLMNDIDISSLGNWVPIGGYEDFPSPFRGVLDGNNHRITGIAMNLAVNYTENKKSAFGGLFGIIGDGGQVKNLGVAGAITATSTKSTYAGGIVALLNGGRIENCYNQVEINASAEGDVYVGGIAGQGANGSAIARCYNVAPLSVSPLKTVYNSALAGGILGVSSNVCEITNCFNMGRITAVTPSAAFAGGIVGYGDRIFTSYNVAQVSATALETSYEYSGGIAGELYLFSQTVLNTYFLSSATSVGIGLYEGGSSPQATGLTDAQMRQKASFVGFDFDAVWEMPAGGGYPVLRKTIGTVTPTTYALTVVSGTGSGNYAAGASVAITANSAPAGQVFDKWTATAGILANADSTSTTFTMPANAATVTATYKAIPVSTYTLTLNPNGGLVTPPSVTQAQGTTFTLPTPTRSGYEFKGWTLFGNGSLNENIYTFGAGNATVTAQWEEIVQPPVTPPTPLPQPPPPTNTIFGTKYEATFFNWILYYVFFGWLWMR